MKAFVRKVFQAGAPTAPSAPLATRIGALTSIYYRTEHAHVVHYRDLPPDPPTRRGTISHAPPPPPPHTPRRDNILIAPNELPEKLRPLSLDNATNILVQDRAKEADHLVRVALSTCMRAYRSGPGMRNMEVRNAINALAGRLDIPPVITQDLLERFSGPPAPVGPTREEAFYQTYNALVGGQCQISDVTTVSGYHPTRHISKVHVEGRVNRPVKDFIELFDPRSWAVNAPESWTAGYPVADDADQKIDRDLDPPPVEAGEDLDNQLFFEAAWWSLGSLVVSTHRNLLRVDYKVTPNRETPSEITFAFRQQGCLDGTFLGAADEGGIDRDFGGASCKLVAGQTEVALSKSLRFTKPVELMTEVNQITSVVLKMWMELLLTASLCEPQSKNQTKPVNKGPGEHPCGCLGVCSCYPRPDMKQVRNDALQRLREVARCGEKISASYQEFWRSQAAIWCALVPDPCAPPPKPFSYTLDSLAVSLNAWGQAYDSYHQFTSALLGLPTKTKTKSQSKASTQAGTIQVLNFVVDNMAECTDPLPLEGISSAFLTALSAGDPPTATVHLARNVRFSVAGAEDQILVSVVNFASLDGVLQPGPPYEAAILVDAIHVATIRLHVRA